MMGPRHESSTVSTTDGLVSVLILLGLRLRSRPFPLIGERSQSRGGPFSLCMRPGPARRGFPRLTEVEEGFYARSL